jgi:beta-glucanase (GH16 family)
MKKYFLILIASLLCLPIITQAQTTQTVQDDFEGNGTITGWFGDDCNINTSLTNPSSQGINTSATVLEYHDVGGQYANVRFEVGNNFDLSTNHTFSLKVYVPSNGLTGSQTNQISLKLQDGTLGSPWTTQSEIIKTITLNQWQTVTFDFQNDTYINLDASSLPPTQRTDFNRVLLQINGENNTDNVLAYIDDMAYDGTIPAPPVFDNLIWSDEFDVNGAINSTNWFHQTQLPAGGSWYNGEIQHYTDRIDNSVVNNGFLKIIAKKETFTNQGQTKTHTSARLNSKFAFKYGRVEVRAKLPAGVGTWPAIWMLGKNINEDGGYWDNQGFGNSNWPACGEVDIMEHWGNNQNYVQSAMHTPSSFGGTINKGGQMIPTASADFHIYALEWTAEKMVFSVDGAVHYTYNPPVKDAATWPFDAEQYILLNIAIEPGIDPNFTESAMEIDYVRIYQQTPTSTVSVKENETFNYYPNPVENELNIVLAEATTQNIVFNIHSIDGKLMQTQNATANGETVRLNGLETLAKGMYFVSYQLEGKLYSFKIVKL